jgi:ribosomal protein S28E/S33
MGLKPEPLQSPMRIFLRIFERKILRKIYGPIQEGDIWRIRNNEELNICVNEEDIVKF